MEIRNQTDLTTCMLYIISQAIGALYHKQPLHPLLTMVEFIPIERGIIQMNASEEFYRRFALPHEKNRMLFTLVSYNDALIQACHDLPYPV